MELTDKLVFAGPDGAVDRAFVRRMIREDQEALNLARASGQDTKALREQQDEVFNRYSRSLPEDRQEELSDAYLEESELYCEEIELSYRHDKLRGENIASDAFLVFFGASVVAGIFILVVFLATR